MKSLEDNLKIIYDCGYYLTDYFALPTTSWTEEYYKPMLNRINLLREQYKSDPQKQIFLDEEQLEIEIFKKYSDYYGYVFYIMQNNLKEQS